MRLNKWPWLSLVASLWIAAGTLAAEPAQPRYNTVEFQVDVQREVQNDLLNASLYVELSDASAALEPLLTFVYTYSPGVGSARV